MEKLRMLSEGARLAGFGCWETDLLNNTEQWSDELFSILELKPAGELRPLEYLIRKVHPEDVVSITQLISDTIKNLDRQHFECRIIRNDGSVGYISVQMAISRDDRNTPTRINGSVRDVSAEHNATNNEKRKMSELVQRNKDLEQFAYIISHNLRAPIANIVGVSNALTDDDLNEDDQKEYKGALAVSVKKLDSLVTDLNNILQVRRQVHENMELVNFADLVEDIKLNLGAALEDQLFVIMTDFSEVPQMWTLRSYMRSIFYNLISNSFKYRKRDLAPVVEIKATRRDGKTVLTFRDNSIGIDLTKEGDRIFGLYKRFHPSYAEGRGMGLFMVKTQVETLGGRISVKSKVNEGTEFTIVFEQDKNMIS